MSTQKTIAFSDLGSSDLVLDARYRGGSFGDVRDDPLNKLIGGGNQGGFRYLGSPMRGEVRLCVLYSELTDPDWPDELDVETGTFIYYGDNKRPGHALHDTQKQGNRILRDMFAALHAGQRTAVPPVFVFTKAGVGRDVVFRGLAVPGAPGLAQTEDLVAIWKSKGGQRFQNYRATFTILDVPQISRAWIEDLRQGGNLGCDVPKPWLDWRKGRSPAVLAAGRSIVHRKRAEQLPKGVAQKRLLDQLVSFFKAHPDREYAFEACAAEITRLLDRNFTSIDLTRPWRDGGRDAIGKYRIGPATSALSVDFALEAKCKQSNSGSGVRDTSRLISRLRHRQFGVFVTTSYVNEQAYKEIVEDDHPVLILAGADIVDVLVRSGIKTKPELARWLNRFR